MHGNSNKRSGIAVPCQNRVWLCGDRLAECAQRCPCCKGNPTSTRQKVGFQAHAEVVAAVAEAVRRDVVAESKPTFTHPNPKLSLTRRSTHAEELAAVAEAVRRDVKYAHQRRAQAPGPGRAAGDRHHRRQLLIRRHRCAGGGHIRQAINNARMHRNNEGRATALRTWVDYSYKLLKPFL